MLVSVFFIRETPPTRMSFGWTEPEPVVVEKHSSSTKQITSILSFSSCIVYRRVPIPIHTVSRRGKIVLNVLQNHHFLLRQIKKKPIPLCQYKTRARKFSLPFKIYASASMCLPLATVGKYQHCFASRFYLRSFLVFVCLDQLRNFKHGTHITC